jgi:glucose-1-phosphate thymidylyltransferase
MKGIVLAGGTGSRLWPSTKSVSKQLLPVYDKPMIYYPISTLMLAGVREILIITTQVDQIEFMNLLGDGSDLGVKFEYAIQSEPHGLAQAFTIGKSFLGIDTCLMILGDNIFYGNGLGEQLKSTLPQKGAHIFTCEVSNPKEYGVLKNDSYGKPISVVEKPSDPESNFAITGLYFFDNKVAEFAERLKPSARGEFEITSLIESYLEIGELGVTQLSRGTAWLDSGTPSRIHDASTFIRVIEERTGLKIACLEEVAFRLGYISREIFHTNIERLPPSEYRTYLKKILEKENSLDG